MNQASDIKKIRDEFLNNPINICNKKIEILKNYYFKWAQNILDINDIEFFRIGSNKNKNTLWFNNINNPSTHLILYIKENKYKIIEKEFNNSNQQKEQIIDIPLENEPVICEKRKESENLINRDQTSCYKRCRIL